MESIRSFFDAAGTFLDHLSEVNVGRADDRVRASTARTCCCARSAWHSIISAAFPRDRIRKRMVLGAYVAGVGINAFAPARGGDVVKIATVRNRVAGSSVPALTSSLLAETVFDFAVATVLLTWAYATGRLPALPDLPNAPAFEWSFIARHTQGAMMAIAIVFIAGWLLAALARAPRARVLAAHRAGRS